MKTPPKNPRVLVPLAEGFEEMEAVIIIDMLRRCGAEVTSAAIADARETRGSRNVTLLADALWQDLDVATFDALVIPGGLGGVEKIRADGRVAALAKNFNAQGRLVAAICAAPLVLLDAGLLRGGVGFTCHPSVADKFNQGEYMPYLAVREENIITGQGPGVTFEFALAIARHLFDEETAQRVGKAACVKPPF